MINLTALRILHRNAGTVHVHVKLPGWAQSRTLLLVGIGSKITGQDIASGELIENIRVQFVIGVKASN